MSENQTKEETAREKFLRVGDQRINKALHYLRLTENLANKQHYEYSQADVDYVVNTLQGAVDRVKEAFSPTPKPKPLPFTLRAAAQNYEAAKATADDLPMIADPIKEGAAA